MSESTQRRDNVQAWLRLAAQDLRAVDHLPADGNVNETRAFHCQQAVEKYLKGLLVAFDVDPERTHDIGLLLGKCVQQRGQFGLDHRYLLFLGCEAGL